MRLHDRHDRPPRPGHRDVGLGADPRRQPVGAHPGASGSSTRSRTRSPRCRRGSATGSQPVPEASRHVDEDGRHGARDADAGHADRGADAAARPGAGRRVRPALPHLHDPAPPGRRLHGEAAVRHLRRRARTRRCSSLPSTSTSISPPRSPAWRRCSPPSHPRDHTQ